VPHGCRDEGGAGVGTRREEQGWRDGRWLEEQGQRRVAGLEVGEGEGQYGQRKYCSGVALIDNGIFVNPFCIMAYERNPPSGW
jgi:hypothetical protein